MIHIKSLVLINRRIKLIICVTGFFVVIAHQCE